MVMKVRYEKGVFKPLSEVTGIAEGEELDISLYRDNWHKLLEEGGSFDFLKDEEDLYTEADIVEKYE